jgi:cardiolipin synthase
VRHFILFLVLINFSCPALSLTKANTQANPPTWLTQITPLENLDFVITPEEDHTKLLKAFQSAQNNIKVGIFGISGQHIVDGLVSAARRGIKVTVICDKYCTSNPKRLELFEQLKNAGVDVVLASTGFTITHWKMFVIDDKNAFISTMNFISRFYQMRDFGIFTTEKSVVKEILEVYNQDLENSKTQAVLTPALTSPHLVWSPNNSETKLIDLINTAKTSIEIWIENMGNKNVHIALKNAVDRKVTVRVLTSMCGLGMNPDAAFANLKELVSYGITVQAMPFPATKDLPYIHAKSINVDHQMIFIGSENFSFNSLMKARELGIVLKDTKIQKKMTEYFEKDWKKSVTLPDAPPETCEALTPTPTPKIPAPENFHH